MPTTVTLIAELAAILGHAMLWISCVNRIHSTYLPRKVLDFGANCAFALLVFLPCWAGYFFYRVGVIPFGAGQLDLLPIAVQRYFWLCIVLCLIGMLLWVVRYLRRRPPSQLLSRRVSRFNFHKVGQPAVDQASWVFRLLARLPFNEVFRPSLVEYEVLISRLPAELDGLVVIHLTDTHINGRTGWGYFEEVVKLSNRQQPDFVMITGDLLDRNTMAEQLAEMFSQFEASVGRYFILGNHDRQIDHKHLQRCISQAGLTNLSGYCESITVRGHQILIAGNESPWFLPSGDFDPVATDGSTGVNHSADVGSVAEVERPLRLLLSHSPDQIDWAMAKEVDLMLAGHLHGGQICLPLIGPLRSPSHYGFKYIGGVYYRDPTLLCVSRGISAQFPLRWNCPPELVKLTLRSGE